MTQHEKLVHTLTEYDMKQLKKRGYNRYALGLYFQALEETEKLVAKGKSWESALRVNFNDRLLDVCLKAIA